MQLIHALNADAACALALDARSAGLQKTGQIHHFRLSGRVFQKRFALCQGRGHEQVFRAAHGGHVKGDVRAFELAAAAKI